MYRKHSNSGKSSRNERLAQLSEQESVIEKKKKEIQARLEAQKKRETEEALRKLETSVKNDSTQPVKNNSWSSTFKKEEESDEQVKPKRLINAFTNDGSFLDQFKKLSNSGLTSKLPDAAALSTGGKNEEDLETNQGKIKDLHGSASGATVRSHVSSYSHLPQGPKPASYAKSNCDAFKPVQNSIQQYKSIPPAYSSDNSSNLPFSTLPPSHMMQFNVPPPRLTQYNIPSASQSLDESWKGSISNQLNKPGEGTLVSPALSNEEGVSSQCDKKSQSRERKGETLQEFNLRRSSDDSATRFSNDSQTYHKNLSISQDTFDMYDGCRKDPCGSKRSMNCEDSSDSDTNSKDSSYTTSNRFEQTRVRDGYQADCEDDNQNPAVRQKKLHKMAEDNSERKGGEEHSNGEKRRKKKSRWGDEVAPAVGNQGIQVPRVIAPLTCKTTGKMPLLSKLTRSDPGLLQYAKQTFGSTNLSEEDWKKAEDHYKINLLYQDMLKKRAEIDSLEKAGKFKYEYDSDEDVEGGTWEHKLRQQEMLATQLWAEELTRQAAGKHHIGDFLPPEELERFMEKYNAVKEGRKPDLSDYKEFKLKEDNVGYRLLQKMGWNEGQGLGQDGSGITHPVNKATTRHENQGLGLDRPDGIEAGDDEYDAYRKRMMLAYRFRPNPLNNPRRPYY